MNAANLKVSDILGRIEHIVPRILRLGSDYGKPSIMPKRERVVIDFSSPNIGKPFHLGHFRATVTGNFIRNINEFMGHEVISINFIGDYGNQFLKLADGYQKFGNKADLEKYGTRHLFEVYVKMNSTDPRYAAEENAVYNERLDREIYNKLWKEFKSISLKDLMNTYKRMGIDFTTYHFESQYVDEALKLSQELVKKGYAVDTPDGTVLKDGEGVIRLLNHYGRSLYLSRDIAAAIHRIHMYDFDRIHYVVSDAQAAHFLRLQHCLRHLGYGEYIDRCQPWGLHIPFGQVIGQSTRRGSVIFLQDILDSHLTYMKERLKEHVTRAPDDVDSVAEVLSWSVICEAIFKFPRSKPVGVRFQDGNEGIRLQYCHARLNSLIEAAAKRGIEPGWSEEAWIHMANNENANMFMLTLLEYENVILDAYETFEGVQLIHYMRKLSSRTNACLKEFRVVDNENHSIARANLAMFMAARQILRNSFKLLGMTPLQEI